MELISSLLVETIHFFQELENYKLNSPRPLPRSKPFPDFFGTLLKSSRKARAAFSKEFLENLGKMSTN
jgi:hypothetical protein